MFTLTRKKSDPLAELGLRPRLGHDLPTMVEWLSKHGLTNTAAVFDHAEDTFLPGADLRESVALAQPTNRHASRPLTLEKFRELKERSKEITLEHNPEELWAALRNVEENVRLLNWEKLPADAMAFYRPFHFAPFDQWGIYLLIGPLLGYHHELVRQSRQCKLFAPGVLMHLIVFEVFNHEFFHHLVESRATTLEVLLAAHDIVVPVYLRHRSRQVSNTFNHLHAPIEEALANAYAYNALSFVCRVKVGFKTRTVNAYQRALERYLPRHRHRVGPRQLLDLTT